MTWKGVGRRRLFGVLLCAALAAAGPWFPAVADDPAPVPVPGSCKLHDQHVVNPGCVPALTDPVREVVRGLPNLVPNVETVQILYTNAEFDETGQPRFIDPVLEFDTHAQNLGYYPLELLAEEDSILTSSLAQCVAWSLDYKCEEKRTVGGFAWHMEHAHFHFQDFATYELRRLGPDGRPDQSDAGLLGRSPKVSFCLVDSKPVREDASPTQRYIQCPGVRQGVSAGWTDIYGTDLPEQEFDLNGIPDGRYALIVRMDYENRIFETDDTDNYVAVIVDISVATETARIVDRQQ